MFKIIFHRNNCIGCGTCYELQPEFWRMSNRDGKASLVNACKKRCVFIRSVGISVLPQMKDVVHSCPVNIIKIQ